MMNTRSIRQLLMALGFVALTLALPVSASAFSFTNPGGFGFDGTACTTAVGGACGKGIEFQLPVLNVGGTLVGGGAPTLSTTIAWGGLAVAGVGKANVFTATNHYDLGTISALRLFPGGGSFEVGDTIVIARLGHQNRSIPDPTLSSAVIWTQLIIKDNGGTELSSTTARNPITFTETLNTATEGECNPATHLPGTPPCSDFFDFSLLSFSPVTFSSGGETFTLNFTVAPVGDTPLFVFEGECDSANPGPDLCGRVSTEEGDENFIEVLATLTRVGVPGPASLVLLGMALLGVGAVGRIRRQGSGK